MKKFQFNLWIVCLILVGVGGLMAAPTAAQTDEEEASEREPTALGSDDIALVGYNAGPNAQFSFLLLSNVTRGTEIVFTDNGWTDGVGLATEESDYVWIAPRDLCAGTVVEISKSSLQMTPGGDQVLAYQRHASGQVSFLFALNSVLNEPAWQDDALSVRRSAVPPGLTNGRNALSLGGPPYAVYAGTTVGTKQQLLDSIANLDNWVTSAIEPQILAQDSYIVLDAAPCKICTIATNQPMDFVGGLTINIVSMGRFLALDCIEVAYQTDTHPMGKLDPRFDLDPIHWRIKTEPTTTFGFQATASMALPRPVADYDRVCQLINQSPVTWECVRPTEFFENELTLRNFGEFTDLSIGHDADLDLSQTPFELGDDPRARYLFLLGSGLFLLLLGLLLAWLMSHYRPSAR